VKGCLLAQKGKLEKTAIGPAHGEVVKITPQTVGIFCSSPINQDPTNILGITDSNSEQTNIGFPDSQISRRC